MVKSFTKIKLKKTKINTKIIEKKSDTVELKHLFPSDKDHFDFSMDLYRVMMNARDAGKMTVKEIERFEYDEAADEYIMDLFDFLVPMGYKLAVVPIEKQPQQ